MLVRILLILLLSFIGQPSFAGFRLNRHSTAAVQMTAPKPRHYGFNPWKRETKEEPKKSILSKLSLAFIGAAGFIFCIFFVYAIAAFAGSLSAGLVLEKMVTWAYPVSSYLNIAGLITGILALCLGQKKKGFAITAIVIGGLTAIPFLASLFL